MRLFACNETSCYFPVKEAKDLSVLGTRDHRYPGWIDRISGTREKEKDDATQSSREWSEKKTWRHFAPSRHCPFPFPSFHSLRARFLVPYNQELVILRAPLYVVICLRPYFIWLIKLLNISFSFSLRFQNDLSHEFHNFGFLQTCIFLLTFPKDSQNLL